MSLVEDLYLLINMHYLKFLVNLNYNVKTCLNFIWRNLKLDNKYKNYCERRYYNCFYVMAHHQLKELHKLIRS